MNIIDKITRFISTDVWRIRLKDIPKVKSFWIKQLRIILLSLRGFGEDKCQLRASALTFYSLLSIVPVVAMAFGIAKGFGFEKILETQLMERLPGQEEVIAYIISFAHAMLENTKGGVVAGIGIAVLFWTVIKVLGNIETSFNDIWGIKEQRPLGRKFSDYISIMMICPVLLIMSSSITVFITTQITLITEKISILGMFSPVIFFFLRLLPYCALWVLFVFIYAFMPNTKVRFPAAVVAGIIAGTVYQLVQWAYISFQVGVAKYNAVYGSFAALPLFLMWLQISWLVVLLGAEISFAYQNVDTYEFEPDCLRVSHSFKELCALRVANVIVKGFAKGEKPHTAEAISHELEIPIRLVRQLLFELEESGIVCETKTEEYKEMGYQPARDIDILSIRYVIDAMNQRGVDTVPVLQNKELNIISDCLASFAKLVTESKENKLLKDI